jgi:transketolase
MNHIDPALTKQTADTIRILSAEAIQKAKSGHPGMPMGCADYAVVLWLKYLKHNPRKTDWLGRDRFILSAGHGSMLLYSLLHLFDYGLSMEEIQEFRQLNSLTPGHPEFPHTPGVEVTTGPLGSGFASAVGMAIANKHFAAKTGLDNSGLIDNKYYVISSDGCMMEGTTHEAASLAGHLKLENLIVFYDDNKITIEGETELAFSEDVGKRFDAYNWRVIKVDDANDIVKIDKALEEAHKSDGRPTIIIGKTQIGFGSPNLVGKEACHGAPLGEEELALTKRNLGFSERPFHVPEAVRKMVIERAKELTEEAEKWEAEFNKYLEANPKTAALVNKMAKKEIPENILDKLLKATPVDKPVATRASGGAVIQKAAELVPALYGGSADLSPSTKTNIKGAESFSASNRAGANFHFGVRELGMGLTGNGIALYGASIPYVSTFFVFSDYMKPALRLAAIQGLHIIYVFTHDSFYVGEDGPTHEPIEQIAMLRTIPGFTVIRPAEAHEVAHAWAEALKTDGPVALLLTRQDLAPYNAETATKIDMSKGAYVISDDDDFNTILIASGSEVNLALSAAEKLREDGEKTRVVSMPCQEFFLKQSREYRDSILPPSCEKRVSIEAATTYGWERFTGNKGLRIGIDHFGESAPYKVLAEKYGFIPEAVTNKIKDFFKIG